MRQQVLTTAERIDWLRLARSESVGPVTFAYLIKRYAGPAEAIAALPGLARRGGRANPLAIVSTEVAAGELSAGEAFGARLVASCEAEFPPRLAALDPSPALLWVLGDSKLLARRCVAIVGARAASAAGRRFARTLAAELGEAGYVVVSGLARGIDASAHEGSLPFATIAVMAGGVDDIYPPDNASLYHQIRATGCVVSERRLGHAARAADFPRRNRIVSGLCLGVVVVEAELRSGSLITARLAGEQGREVFAVPGSPLDPRARGANDLLRQGAALVEGAEDVLRVLDPLPDLAEPERPAFAPATSPADEAPVELVGRVAELLSPTPSTVDDLARSAAAPIAQVLAAVMELSLAGKAEILPGGYVVAA